MKPPEYLSLALITTTFGVKGEVKIRPESDDPLRLRELAEVSCLLVTGDRITLLPEQVTLRKDGTVIGKFKSYDSPEVAEKLRGAKLQVPFAQAKRVKGKVLFADMLGMKAVEEEGGKELGTVSEVYSATQDILAVTTPDGREVLVPWVDVFVKAVDVEAGLVRLTPIPGMFD